MLFGGDEPTHKSLQTKMLKHHFPPILELWIEQDLLGQGEEE